MMNIEELFDYDDNEYIIGDIISSLLQEKITDKNMYCNRLHIYIDEYVVKYPYKAKKLVNDYDVFRSIKLSRDNYGQFEIQEGKLKNYMMLGYVLIDEYFSEYYSFKDLIRDLIRQKEDRHHDSDEDRNSDSDSDVPCI